MTHPTGPRTTSAAKTISPSPESFSRASDVASAFEKSRTDTPSPAQSGSTMDKQDQPKPAPRPSPSLAAGPDAAAFNTRWQAERDNADKAARRAEFVATRKAASPTRTVTRSRTD